MLGAADAGWYTNYVRGVNIHITNIAIMDNVMVSLEGESREYSIAIKSDPVTIEWPKAWDVNRSNTFYECADQGSATPGWYWSPDYKPDYAWEDLKPFGWGIFVMAIAWLVAWAGDWSKRPVETTVESEE